MFYIPAAPTLIPSALTRSGMDRGMRAIPCNSGGWAEAFSAIMIADDDIVVTTSTPLTCATALIHTSSPRRESTLS